MFLWGCQTTCNCEFRKEKVVQKIYSINKKVVLIKNNHGAFGNSLSLYICKKNKKFLEKINIRIGNNDYPVIDSMVNENIYISYSYPWKENGALSFDEVVVGKALMNKNSLKFNYIFINKKSHKCFSKQKSAPPLHQKST